MREITLKASGPATGAPDFIPLYHGKLPEGWHEVGLAHYAQLASAKRHAERITATAAICGLPADVLLADVGIYGAIVREATWVFTLPVLDLAEREQVITHLGEQYSFVGDLHRINAGQLEALLDFLNQHKAAPLLAAPSLLAVLYTPTGQKQTADSVERTAKAFETLPVSVAWPAISDFLRSGASMRPQIQASEFPLLRENTFLSMN